MLLHLIFIGEKINRLVLTLSLGRTNTQLVNIHIFKILPAVYETQFIVIHHIERIMKGLVSYSIKQLFPMKLAEAILLFVDCTWYVCI